MKVSKEGQVRKKNSKTRQENQECVSGSKLEAKTAQSHNKT